ncbi:MAG TPA: DUF3027 domain-containing protein [Nocardioidaceae bacterium]|jgi:hypothetical protein|nr:DUF3027 domain-containing protein [Nocardioidaceae bacterium]
MGDNVSVTTTTRTAKTDAVCAEAVDIARGALLDVVAEQEVGDHLGCQPEAERVVTHSFEARRPGYTNWRWSVTVARASRRREVTVDEIVLLPGAGALLPPPWVPWRERVHADDLSPGALLPAAANDARLVPGFTGADEEIDADAVHAVVEELGLGRPRVLSPTGRDLAVERWYEGSHGPTAPIAVSAPAPCATCGFVVRLAGALGAVFAVCTNEFSPSDGKTVSYDHGCGAHSEVAAAHPDLPAADVLPQPVFETVTYDEITLA